MSQSQHKSARTAATTRNPAAGRRSRSSATSEIVAVPSAAPGIAATGDLPYCVDTDDREKCVETLAPRCGPRIAAIWRTRFRKVLHDSATAAAVGRAKSLDSLNQNNDGEPNGRAALRPSCSCTNGGGSKPAFAGPWRNLCLRPPPTVPRTTSLYKVCGGRRFCTRYAWLVVVTNALLLTGSSSFYAAAADKT